MSNKGTSLDNLAREHNAELARQKRNADRWETEKALAMVSEEIRRAYEKHPVGFHTAHEGYAVILEELDEMWDEVKTDNLGRARIEAVQVAAMAIRFLVDLPLPPEDVS